MELQIGDEVVVKSDEGGEFDGVVQRFERDGSVAIIKPDEPALRRWFPNGYDIGRAHWGALVVHRPAGKQRSFGRRLVQALTDDFGNRAGDRWT